MSYVDDLHQVIGATNYQGCLIQPIGDGKYTAIGQEFYDLKSAKVAIRKVIEWVEVEPNVFVTKQHYDSAYKTDSLR